MTTDALSSCFVGLAVRARVVYVDDESGDRRVKFRKRQCRRACRLSLYQAPGEFGQKFCVDRAEESLDLAAALRPCGLAACRPSSG